MNISTGQASREVPQEEGARPGRRCREAGNTPNTLLCPQLAAAPQPSSSVSPAPCYLLCLPLPCDKGLVSLLTVTAVVKTWAVLSATSTSCFTASPRPGRKLLAWVSSEHKIIFLSPSLSLQLSELFPEPVPSQPSQGSFLTHRRRAVRVAARPDPAPPQPGDGAVSPPSAAVASQHRERLRLPGHGPATAPGCSFPWDTCGSTRAVGSSMAAQGRSIHTQRACLGPQMLSAGLESAANLGFSTRSKSSFNEPRRLRVLGTPLLSARTAQPHAGAHQPRTGGAGRCPPALCFGDT